MPKISVIVPIYKVEKYLCQCIDSILSQTLKDIEVILVDEGDLDTCRAIIDMYEFGAKKDSRVKSIHENNGGYGASVNKGINIATGEYISIIESDDFIEPTMYEEMYAYAQKLDADVVKTPYYEYWDKTEYLQEKFVLPACYNLVKNIPENKLFSIENYPQLLSIHPSIWSAIYKKEFLKSKNICLLEAKGAGYVDNYFRIETLCSTDKISWFNKAYYHYRLTNANASQANYNISTFIERWNDVHKMFDKKFPDKWSVLEEYCIREEITNIYERIIEDKFFLNEKDMNLLKNNLTYLNENKLKNISSVKYNTKRKIIEFKKDHTKIKKYSKHLKTNTIKLFGLKLFEVEYSNPVTILIQICNINIPIIKIKKRINNRIKVYFLGIIPFLEIIE